MEPERLGPYRIVGTLGYGGMGTVYEGVNVDTGEPAALKILSASLSKQSDFRQRFGSEIETLMKLRHPNIVRLLGFGEQGNMLFYAMELVHGDTLEDQLQRGRLFTWREVARIGIQTCRALRHAHDRGVVHRDLKPANLLQTSDGQVKLSDFGISKLFGQAGITAAGNVLGTVEFMAPEQAESRPIGPRTDLYSLGAVFFALLTGRPPFRASTPLKTLEKQRFATPEPVRRYAPNVPAEMEDIICHLLKKAPKDRIPNATLLMRRLEAMMHALADLPDSPGTGVVQTAVGGFDLPSSAEAPDRRNDRKTPSPGGDDDPTRLSTTAGDPLLAAEQMPETRATSAFQDYAKAENGSGAAAETIAPSETEQEEEPPKPSSHFITVDEDQLDRVEPAEPSRPPLFSPQMGVFAVTLVAMGLIAWYFLQPPSKEDLYRRIMATTADKTTASYAEAGDDIREFLVRFSDDPRCAQLREFEQEVELEQLERRFERRAWGQTSTEALLPIERAYLEAIKHVRLFPEQGTLKLQAIVDLYRHRSDKSGPTGQIVQLAQRRLDQLRRQQRLFSAQDVAWLRERLDQADELESTDPAEAESIRRAVITLYADKAWAGESVQRAQKALAAEKESP